MKPPNLETTQGMETLPETLNTPGIPESGSESLTIRQRLASEELGRIVLPRRLVDLVDRGRDRVYDIIVGVGSVRSSSSSYSKRERARASLEYRKFVGKAAESILDQEATTEDPLTHALDMDEIREKLYGRALGRHVHRTGVVGLDDAELTKPRKANPKATPDAPRPTSRTFQQNNAWRVNRMRESVTADRRGLNKLRKNFGDEVVEMTPKEVREILKGAHLTRRDKAAAIRASKSAEKARRRMDKRTEKIKRQATGRDIIGRILDRMS
jgi:hypothetical protein